MPAPSSPHIWITAVGLHPFETLNPLWRFLDQERGSLAHIHLFATPEQEAGSRRCQANIAALAKAYKGQWNLTVHTYDDEDVAAFEKQVTRLLASEKHLRRQVIIDASPTTWSFVPLLLARLAARLLPSQASIFYLQYGFHPFRFRPYPLIPRQALKVHFFRPAPVLEPGDPP